MIIKNIKQGSVNVMEYFSVSRLSQPQVIIMEGM